MKFLVECEAFPVGGTSAEPTRAEYLMVEAATDRTALTVAAAHVRATWPEARDPRAGVLVAAPRPVFLSVGHAIDFHLANDLAYLIGYMVDEGDDGMELEHAASYIAAALYGAVDCGVDWSATDAVIKPRVARRMLQLAAAARAARVPEELVS